MKLALGRFRGWIGLIGFAASIAGFAYVAQYQDHNMFWYAFIAFLFAGIASVNLGLFHLGYSGCVTYHMLDRQEKMHEPALDARWYALPKRIRLKMSIEDMREYFLQPATEKEFYDGMKRAKTAHIHLCDESSCRFLLEKGQSL